MARDRGPLPAPRLDRLGRRARRLERFRRSPRYRRSANAVCTHTDSIAILELPDEIAGCEECLKAGDRWVHLRMCTSCGTIRCCDSSPNRHASRHAREAAHPIARSAEPGERWSWCYVDEVAFVVD